MANNNKEQIRYPDSIQIDGGRMVRLTNLNPRTELSIKGHKIRVSSIPYVAALLECSEPVRGIALSEGDLVFCEKHGEETRVAQITGR